MFCINPIVIEGRGTFPCGMCRFCRLMRSSQWTMRMLHEKQFWKKSCFVTLTYNDENLFDADLHKRDVQLFLKRLRKSIEPEKMKYFACGEYGEKYGRPHYHLVIFGLGECDKNIIDNSWKKGFIKVETLTDSSARYVTKYVTKAPLGKSRRDKLYALREPEFQLCSKGIGLSWLLQNIEAVGESGITFRKRKVSVPRYYVDKIKKANVPNYFVEEAEFDRVQESSNRLDSWRKKGLSEEQIWRRKKDVVIQRIEDMKSKDSLYSKKDRDDQ